MDRKKQILKCFDASDELTMNNPEYEKFTRRLFDFLLEMDLGEGDATQYPAKFYEKTVECAIIVKEKGVVAGLEEVTLLLTANGIQVTKNYQDGDRVKIGDVLMILSGQAGKILALERTILNVLQRLCGIATMTSRYRERIPGEDTFIIGTRKTLWGFWDKRAVQCGGGLTHRLNLQDAAMLKENHLNLLKTSQEEKYLNVGLENIVKNNPRLRFVEVEVTDEKEFWQAAYALDQLHTAIPKVIMFDHFTLAQIKKNISEMELKGLYAGILLEASGNITLDSVGKFAESGVDVISSGALTHSVPGLDLSLLFDYK